MAWAKPLQPPALQHHPTHSERACRQDGKSKNKPQRQAMAIGRISVKTGGKGRGASHANYILRQDKYKLHAQKKEKLGVTQSGNMPSWAKDDPVIFWKMADEKERKNGSVYREHILSLPRELSDKQQLQLVKDWINQELGDKHPYTFAIHRPLATDGKEQPHCHLMICERELDGIERGGDTFFKRYNSKNPEKGGARKANTGLSYTVRKEQLKQQRERWGNLVNHHLEKAKSKSRVDMRNWRERGLSKEPINLTMQQFKVYGEEFTKNKIELAKKQRYEDRKLAFKQLGEKITKNVDNVKSGINETFNTIKSGIDILTVSIHAEVVNEQEQAEKQRQQKERQQAEQQRKKIERLDKLRPVEIINEWEARVAEKAKRIWIEQLGELGAEGKELLKEFEKLRDNEPFLGKDKWQHDKQQALDAYNAIKEKHDSMRVNGVTGEHKKQAREQLSKDEPVIHERVKQAIIQELRDEAKKHGVDSYADDGRPYRGKIIKSDDKMSLQQTDKGIVYHYIGGLEVGKDYTLTSYGDKYRVQKHESLEQQQSQEKTRQYGKNDDKGR